MLKIINCSLIILIAIIAIPSKAQPVTLDSSVVLNSTKIEKHTLHLNPLLNSRKLFLGQDDFQINDNEFSLSSKLSTNDGEQMSLSELKMQLNDYLNERKSLLPNYDLGEFGKYLGYANTFAVILMAIAHISKYGFK